MKYKTIYNSYKSDAHIIYIKIFFVLNATYEINKHFRLAVFLYKYYSYEKKYFIFQSVVY